MRLAVGEVIFKEGDPGDSLTWWAKARYKISKIGRGGTRRPSGSSSPTTSARWPCWTASGARPWPRRPNEPSWGRLRHLQHILELQLIKLHMNFLRKRLRVGPRANRTSSLRSCAWCYFSLV